MENLYRFVNTSEAKLETTERGFGVVKFKDLYDVPCLLQESSLATSNAIWLGTKPTECAKWKDPEQCGEYDTVPMPKEYLISTRMLLDQKQVKELLPHLIRFAETGSLT